MHYPQEYCEHLPACPRMARGNVSCAPRPPYLAVTQCLGNRLLRRPSPAPIDDLDDAFWTSATPPVSPAFPGPPRRPTLRNGTLDLDAPSLFAPVDISMLSRLLRLPIQLWVSPSGHHLGPHDGILCAPDTIYWGDEWLDYTHAALTAVEHYHYVGGALVRLHMPPGTFPRCIYDNYAPSYRQDTLPFRRQGPINISRRAHPPAAGPTCTTTMLRTRYASGTVWPCIQPTTQPQRYPVPYCPL